MRHILLCTTLFLMLVLIIMISEVRPAYAQDPCLDCHRKETPGIVTYWEKSAHFKKNIGCAGCHGTDKEANHAKQITVDASRCGSCHNEVLTAHRQGRHGIGLKTGQGCTRNMEKTTDREKSCGFCHRAGSSAPFVISECAMFLAQSPEMQRQGCSSCHRVEVRCDTCHTKHGTELALAREPEICGVCHMGPDHPQYEMWETSLHGVIYKYGGLKNAPDCVTCHMYKGSHNVSRGISAELPKEAEARKEEEREFMVNICSGCHTKSLAQSTLDDADRIQKQGEVLIEEAKKIIEGLNSEGLLYPGTAKRPPHPLFGDKFVIGPHMLYENLSFVESLFFKMKQFYYLTSYKGVFHQNPDYAHWYGNAPMKLTLSEIRSEAALLRQVDTIQKRLDILRPRTEGKEGETSGLKTRLREFQEKRLKGEITDKEYEAAKQKLLDEEGL